MLENKRAKNFKNSAKCAYKPIYFDKFHQKLNFAKNVNYDPFAFNRRYMYCPDCNRRYSLFNIFVTVVNPCQKQ